MKSYKQGSKSITTLGWSRGPTVKNFCRLERIWIQLQEETRANTFSSRDRKVLLKKSNSQWVFFPQCILEKFQACSYQEQDGIYSLDLKILGEQHYRNSENLLGGRKKEDLIEAGMEEDKKSMFRIPLKTQVKEKQKRHSFSASLLLKFQTGCIFVVVDCFVHYRMFAILFGLYSLDARSSSTPTAHKNVHRH